MIDDSVLILIGLMMVCGALAIILGVTKAIYGTLVVAWVKRGGGLPR